MELGGPEVGRGCGGRGIIHGFELLEKLGFHDWGFDYVLLDFLGDVVCGGFGLPIARDMCQKVIVVGSNDLQSLYVANNVCSAVEYFRKMGGNVGVAGLVINKDDGTGEARPSPRRWGSRCWPPSPSTTTSVGRAPTTRSWAAREHAMGAPSSRSWPMGWPTAPPLRPNPLDHDGLLDLFKGDAVGRGVVLTPASPSDMMGGRTIQRESLEIIYETV
jgi:3,8-divinyl chlorophyllide a/chlorophyllide a reductase subunit X